MSASAAITSGRCITLIDLRMTDFTRVSHIVDNAATIIAIEDLAADSAAHGHDHESLHVYAPAHMPRSGRNVVEEVDVASGSFANYRLHIREFVRGTSNG